MPFKKLISSFRNKQNYIILIQVKKLADSEKQRGKKKKKEKNERLRAFMYQHFVLTLYLVPTRKKKKTWEVQIMPKMAIGLKTCMRKNHVAGWSPRKTGMP